VLEKRVPSVDTANGASTTSNLDCSVALAIIDDASRNREFVRVIAAHSGHYHFRDVNRGVNWDVATAAISEMQTAETRFPAVFPQASFAFFRNRELEGSSERTSSPGSVDQYPIRIRDSNPRALSFAPARGKKLPRHDV